MRKTIYVSLVCLAALSCKNRQPQPVKTITPAAPSLVVSIEVNTAVFTPDKNHEDALICRLYNKSDSMLVMNLDTLFRFFTLYGQGETQKYPMFMRYNIPSEKNNDILYIDPGKSEVLFRSPLNQLFFRQLPFREGEYGWMWKSMAPQKANHSPVHDYDTMQKSASLWFDLRLNGKTYTSEKAGFSIEMNK